MWKSSFKHCEFESVQLKNKILKKDQIWCTIYFDSSLIANIQQNVIQTIEGEKDGEKVKESVRSLGNMHFCPGSDSPCNERTRTGSYKIERS